MITIEAIASARKQLVTFVLIGVGIWALVKQNSITAQVSKNIEHRRSNHFDIKRFFLLLAIGFIHGWAGTFYITSSSFDL